jgi:hypothetical protein
LGRSFQSRAADRKNYREPSEKRMGHDFLLNMIFTTIEDLPRK